MKRKIALSFVTSLLLSQSIYAKDTPKKLDSIMVTAQKMEENVQKVPISISVFNEFEIEDRKIESVFDVAEYTPNFTLMDQSGGYMTPTIRGMSNSLPASTSTSQSSSILMDGIPISNSYGFNEALMDIERIEVLKGPQGTLYGKEAQSGVINIITKQPDNELRGKIGLELGSDNKRQYTLSASGPIIENELFIGLSAKHYEKDGFIKNTLLGGYTNDREHKYGRVNLRYTPTNNLEISLISSKLEKDNGNINYVIPYIPGEISTALDKQGYSKLNTTAHALKVSYDINDYLLESITTYRNVELDEFTVYSFFDYTFNKDDDKYSQEFRLSNNNGLFKWLVGVYGDKTDSENIMNKVNPTTQKSDSLGAFIHTEYAINDKFSFVSGARYDKDNKEYERTTTKLDLSENEISPKVSLKYQHDEDSMYYATISKAYRAGGFHPHAPDGYSDQYDSETLWNYEIGAKNTFFDNRFTVNTAIFYMDMDDKQVRIYPINNSNLSYVDNAAKATSKGFEIGLNGKLTPNIELFASYGYTDVTLDDYSDSRGNYSDNKNPFSPAYNYNIGVQYRGDQGYFARADLNGFGRTYLDIANNHSRDPYKVVNAKLGYEADIWDIYLYGKNIFDKEYPTIGLANGSGVLYSEPREIGVQLAYRF